MAVDFAYSIVSAASGGRRDAPMSSKQNSPIVSGAHFPFGSGRAALAARLCPVRGLLVRIYVSKMDKKSVRVPALIGAGHKEGRASNLGGRAGQL